MKKGLSDYFVNLKSMFDNVIACGVDMQTCDIQEVLSSAIDMIAKAGVSGKKLLLIGNGASASIASHMATDFWKNAGIKALSFNDSSLLTCISNDYGYPHVFEKPIEMFIEPQDVLIAISSSGQSENILRGVFAAKEQGAGVLTFSGFKPDNPLRKLGEINFYVPIEHYGYVEVVHLALCHCLADMIIENRTKLKERIESHE